MQNLAENFYGFIAGGAPLDPAVGEFFERIGIKIFQGYGLSETSPVISMDRGEDRKLTSVGPILDSYDAKLMMIQVNYLLKVLL